MPTFWGHGIAGLIVFISVFLFFLWWKKTKFVNDIYNKTKLEEQTKTEISEEDTV